MNQIDPLGDLLGIVSAFTSGFNWIDILIILVLAFYIIEGYAIGFISGAIDFLSFLSSFIIAFKYYAFFAGLLVKAISVSVGFSNALGFMLAAFISELAASFVLKRFVFSSFSRIFFSKLQLSRANNLLGVVPGFLSSLIIVTFFLAFIVSLPVSPILKNYVFSSKIGSFLVSASLGFEKNLNSIFGGAVSDTLNFLTIEPKSNESLNLHFTTNKFVTDYKTEDQMFSVVNQEREKRNLAKLTFSNELAAVGRAHCEDMFKRGYFSHYTPEELSPFDRMDKAGVVYSYAGENLALAPSVITAMQGLMQSPGHRENILSPNFGQVGIGIIDGGVYGKMFCQEFTD